MKCRKIAVCAAFVMLFAAAVCYQKEVAAAVISAGSRCVLVIIPSLYLFSILAAFCIRSGVLETIAAPLDCFGRKFFRMSGILLMILLFSQTAGYPIGTQLLQQLRQKGGLQPEKEDALLCVCFGCGPAFMLGTVGGMLRLTPKLSVLLMLSVVLPNILFALLLAGRCDFRNKAVTEPRLTFTSAEFTASVENGASAMIKICSMILVFAALVGIAEGSGVPELLSGRAADFLHCSPNVVETCFFAILEISNLTEFLRQGGSLPWAAALLSFGGICVHLQNAAICGRRFPWRKFWCIRILAACCSYGLCTAAIQLCFDGDVPAALLFEPMYESKLTTQGVIPVLCLLVMSCLLLAQAEKVQGMKKITK